MLLNAEQTFCRETEAGKNAGQYLSETPPTADSAPNLKMGVQCVSAQLPFVSEPR